MAFPSQKAISIHRDGSDGNDDRVGAQNGGRGIREK
jgi:hypothetical protein